MLVVLKSAAMRKFDVAIVGAGVMGAAAACELARQGARVALLDQATLPNPRAASIDHSKVFRFAYPDQLYVKLAVDALERWRELESQTGRRLLTQTGALLIGKRQPSFASECYEALRAQGQSVDWLNIDDIATQFPQFNGAAFSFGVYDPSGAILHADTAVRALIDLAKQRAVNTIEGARVSAINQVDGSRVSIVTESRADLVCERAVIATGPWSRRLLPVLAGTLTTTRQELVYFEPVGESDASVRSRQSSFEPGEFPIFLELESGFYGFPIHHTGVVKIANHLKGAEVDPTSMEDHVDEQFIESCRAFFAEFIPALEIARVRETRVCIYNNTPDDDFIIDWHPQMENVLIVTGFSGHGFKFGPTVGRIAADLLLGGRSAFGIDRFRLTRFNNKER
ncbi:MAG: N-methyl-L-tryptophan oxidase [Blastocatellia bacterium]